MNLIDNSLKHTFSSRIEVHVALLGDSAELKVIDSGPGMNASGVEKAFERFWQADASRHRPGAGLGLPIVAAIVAAHGGTVALEWDSAMGTTSSSSPASVAYRRYVASTSVARLLRVRRSVDEDIRPRRASIASAVPATRN